MLGILTTKETHKLEMTRPMTKSSKSGSTTAGRMKKLSSKQRMPDRVDSKGSTGSERYAFLSLIHI